MVVVEVRRLPVDEDALARVERPRRAPVRGQGLGAEPTFRLELGLVLLASDPLNVGLEGLAEDGHVFAPRHDGPRAAAVLRERAPEDAERPRTVAEERVGGGPGGGRRDLQRGAARLHLRRRPRARPGLDAAGEVVHGRGELPGQPREDPRPPARVAGAGHEHAGLVGHDDGQVGVLVAADAPGGAAAVVAAADDGDELLVLADEREHLRVVQRLPVAGRVVVREALLRKVVLAPHAVVGALHLRRALVVGHRVEHEPPRRPHGDGLRRPDDLEAVEVAGAE
mmetsp:Transcript_8796/g.28883  ORF Transcript_8796/g.28883 Transcript_8796/m.28883 type:complete len:282 (+) Transcript_8796:1326-2171(+)